MKHSLCLIAIIYLPFIALCQPAFESGYFVDANGQKIECLIKIEDWTKKPTLDYMTARGEAVQTKPLGGLKEFAVHSQIKMVKAKVNLDISSDDVNLLSLQKEPEWIEDNLFLDVLVEGKFNLYFYKADDITRYFFSQGTSPIEQLVYKRYKDVTGIHSNNAYQTTLLDRINCMDTTSAYFKRLRYQKADLVRHFKLHNICEGSEPIIYASATKISEPDTKPAAEPSKLISARSEPIAFQTNERQRKRVHYIGIEGNRLVRQLFNMSGNNDVFNNPYVLQYSMNKRTTGRGFNVGFSYDNNTLSGNSTAGTPVDTKLRTVFFRMGFDRKWAWGKRWTGVFGFDFLLSGSLDRTTTNNTTFGTVTTETHSNGGGLGPRFGLMYHISEKIFLGTEASFYFQSFNEFENASFIGPNPGPGPGPFISNPNQTRTTFSLTPPVGLYLIIKFRE